MEDKDRQYKLPFVFTGEDMDDLLALLSPPLREHSKRVALCSAIMAEYAGGCYEQSRITSSLNLELTTYLAGSCHDVGKLVLPNWEHNQCEYRRHPDAGARLLEQYWGVLFDNETQAKLVMNVVRHHHERPDGNGFPSHIKAGEISLVTGICSVANTLDGFLGGGMILEKDLDEILRCFQHNQGILFCHMAVSCLEKSWNILLEKYEEWNEIGFQHTEPSTQSFPTEIA